MCGEAAWALRWSRLSHFSITTNVSAPYLAPGPPSASAAGPYSMQPASACTAAMLARNAASTSSRLPGLAVRLAITWIISVYPVRSVGNRGRIEAMIAGGYRDGTARHEIRHFPRAIPSPGREPDAGDGARHGTDRMARLARL